MSRLKNERIKAHIDQEVMNARKDCASRIRNARRLREFTGLIERVEPLISGWFGGIYTGKLYLEISGTTKAEFSSKVRQIAEIIGEAPDIRVNPGQYIADFTGARVHVYLSGAEDCRIIEVTETKTVTVMKPHPACLAALRELE